MSKSDSLFQIERDSRRIFLMDGLVDMMLGIFLVLMSFWIISRYLIFHMIWLVAAQIIIEAIRKKTIYPRVGFAKFRNQTRLPFVIIFVSIAIIAVLSGIIALIAGVLHLPRYNLWKIITLATTFYVPIIFSIFAYHHKAYRWIFYGLLMAILMQLGIFSRITNTTVILFLFISTGFIITAIGAIIFTKFLQTYQPYSKEVHDG